MCEEKTIEELNDVEEWALYLGQYVDGETVLKNGGSFSYREMEAAQEVIDESDLDPSKDASEIEEEIRHRLKMKLGKRLDRDPHYLTVLEYLKIVSEKRGASAVIEQTNVEELDVGLDGHLEKRLRKVDELKPFISDLEKEGLIISTIGTYRLTPEFLDVLEEFEKRARTESYALSTEEEATDKVNEILHRADEEILLVDPYFDSDALALIDATVPKRENISIKIIRGPFDASRGMDNRQELEERLDQCWNEQIYNVKHVSNHGDLPHDRFIIIDEASVWQPGHSFNNIGDSFCTIFSHETENAEQIISEIEQIWDNSNSI